MKMKQDNKYKILSFKEILDLFDSERVFVFKHRPSYMFKYSKKKLKLMSAHIEDPEIEWSESKVTINALLESFIFIPQTIVEEIFDIFKKYNMYTSHDLVSVANNRLTMTHGFYTDQLFFTVDKKISIKIGNGEEVSDCYDPDFLKDLMNIFVNNGFTFKDLINL